MNQSSRILVIEDNEDVRLNLVEILELYGYKVDEATNGLEGVKQAVKCPPDIILCDISMPELDGYGVINILSQQENTANIPFIFITAKTEKEDMRRGMNLGADDYITKPFYKDELLNVIQTRLKKAAQRGHAQPSKQFNRLSDPERGKIHLENTFEEAGHSKFYKHGQLVVREGEYPHFIYQVTEGRVHLVRSHEYGRDYIIAELGPGEIFGIPTTLEKIPFHYNAKAATDDCCCQLLGKEKFFDLINEDYNVAEAIMHLMAERVVAHDERLVHQAYDSVRRRTALILCDLHEKYGASPIDLSREELAQMVGATKESVIRSLSDFKKEKLIATKGRSIQLLDQQGLYSLLV